MCGSPSSDSVWVSPTLPSPAGVTLLREHDGVCVAGFEPTALDERIGDERRVVWRAE